jgi:tRNA (cytidine/uridine-2'-O-)-methyltransferase
MKIALFEPDIPQNTGTIIRMAACLGVGVDVIEPCGFVFSDKHLKRSGMDYLDMVEVVRHADWAAFVKTRQKGDGRRLVLLTTKGATPYTQFNFTPGDVLVLGSESKGAADFVHDSVDARVTVPMVGGARSLNVAMACAMVLGEALRQTRSPSAVAPV